MCYNSQHTGISFAYCYKLQPVHYSLTTCRISTVFVQYCSNIFHKNMENTMLSPACEVRSVIRFLQAQGNGAAQIHRRLCAVYGIQ